MWLTLPLVLGLKDELEALTAPKSVLTYRSVMVSHSNGWISFLTKKESVCFGGLQINKELNLYFYVIRNSIGKTLGTTPAVKSVFELLSQFLQPI